MINSKIKVQIVLRVYVWLFVIALKMSKVRGCQREEVGLGEGGHGSLLWPELALAAPGLEGETLVVLE